MGPEADLSALASVVEGCRACPRLVAWREEVAVTKRAAFANEEYWGRPIPGYGDPEARLLVLGLAPAAHGGNRTGRVFTGDRSGDWLYASMFRTGWCNQPTSVHRRDGLRLTGAYVTAGVKCAPPANKPKPAERDECFPYLLDEMRLLARLRVIVALGGFAWEVALRAIAELHSVRTSPKPRFRHGVEREMGPYVLLGCYHPSQQNTFTGKLTEAMTDAVFARAATLSA